MSKIAANTLFENFSRIEPRLPPVVWILLRAVTLCVSFGLAALLIVSPALGLKLFWGVVIPCLPILFVVAPGFWRNICPMALANQMPRVFGFSRGATLPDWLRDRAFAVAVGSFFVVVGLRTPLLNHTAPLVAILVIGAIILAFIGGLFFKGRSGWCGTFCPLGPIQRDYGQAPLLMVRNGWCSPCVGCQKNCYDFNPRAAVFGDMADPDERYTSQRRFFFAMMPGMVTGYFLNLQAAASPTPPDLLHQALVYCGFTAASVGLYQVATSFLGLSAYRLASLFGGLALIAFYFFAGPIVVHALGDLMGRALPVEASWTSRGVGAVLSGLLLISAFANERVYLAAAANFRDVRIVPSGASLKDRLAAATAAEITDRGAGVSFPVAPGQSLLDALEAARIKINFGCRSGLCGADAVAICDGAENLSPPSEDELATLRRLGLEGKARLACVCEATGPVTIDRDVRNAQIAALPTPATAEPAAPAVDLAAAAGIGRVVIVGNGVAGLGVAEGLRRASPSVEISLVTDEPHHFYNRMAIGRLIYGRAALDSLHLLPTDWYDANRIDVWLNTLAVDIDREAGALCLGTGESLPYDRLVLATGARAGVPDSAFPARRNGFVLRSAADAQEVRNFVQRAKARRGVVIGGGVLGVEAADALHHLGLEVTILQRSERLMERQLDQEGAARLANYLAGIGVVTLTGARIASFEGTEQLDAVLLDDGRRIEGDLFVACAGIVCNTDLAKRAGLEVNRGIVVDRHMRTSDPRILAVGDAAELPGEMAGLWPVGAANAKAAVSAILDTAPQPYTTPRILLQLKCDGVDLRSFGVVEPASGDQTVTAAPEQISWWRVVWRDGVLKGALFIGPPGSSRDFTRLLQSGDDVEPLLAKLRDGSETPAR